MRIGRHRREDAKQEAREARELRANAENELAKTEENRQREDREIVQPLRRARNSMIQYNHVTAEIVRLIREGR